MLNKLTLSLVILLLLVITGFSYEEGIINMGGHTHSLVFDNSMSNIVVGSGFWPTYIKTVDPSSAEIDQTYDHSFIGNFAYAASVDNGLNILVLLSETDGNERTEESILYKLEASDGDIICQTQFDEWATDMVVSDDKAYAYISIGLSLYENGEILKINTGTLNTEDCVEFGKYCPDIDINNSGTKLYAHDHKTRSIGVIDTSDMILIRHDLKIGPSVGHTDCNLKMGYDNRLFVSVANPILADDETVIYVIDTNTDEFIEPALRFGDYGIPFMDINPVNHMLYALASTRTYYWEEVEEYCYEPTNMILELDLNDYSYRFFTIGSEPMWDIAVAYDNYGLNRLFCIASADESPNIYYKDVE